MINNKILFTAAVALVFIYTSCNKISDSIRRDIIITDSAFFKIPTISSLDDSVTLTNIVSTVDIEKQINDGAPGFSLADVTNVKITALAMDLGLPTGVDTIDTKNNFGNIQTARVEISAGSTAENLAIVNNTSGTTSGNLSLTLLMQPATLKNYLNNPSKKYNVIIRVKKVVTTEMAVRIRAVYTITVAK